MLLQCTCAQCGVKWCQVDGCPSDGVLLHCTCAQCGVKSMVAPLMGCWVWWSGERSVECGVWSGVWVTAVVTATATATAAVWLQFHAFVLCQWGSMLQNDTCAAFLPAAVFDTRLCFNLVPSLRFLVCYRRPVSTHHYVTSQI